MDGKAIHEGTLFVSEGKSAKPDQVQGKAEYMLRREMTALFTQSIYIPSSFKLIHSGNQPRDAVVSTSTSPSVRGSS